MISTSVTQQGLQRAAGAFAEGRVAEGLRQIQDTVSLTRDAGREVAPTTWKAIASLVNRGSSMVASPKGGGSPRPKGGGGSPRPKGGGSPRPTPPTHPSHPTPKGGGHPRPK